MPSISLLASIPLVSVFGVLSAAFLSHQLTSEANEYLSLGIFGGCFLVTSIVFSRNILPRLKVCLHELKHAAIVILTGNRITDFHFEKNTGHVKFEISSRKIRFRPLIALAPYFYPLLSLPVLLISFFMWDYYILIASGLLGAALGIDLTTAWRDLHPKQTDLKIKGGFLVFGPFLAFSNFSWLMICTIWALGGNSFLYKLAYFLYGCLKLVIDK